MKNSEQPAFPLVINHETHQPFDGLTKREYFAIKIMQGLLANQRMRDRREYISLSILMADEILKELERK